MADHTIVSDAAPGPQRSETFWNLAAAVRGRVMFAGVLSALGAVASLVPVIAAMELARTLVPALGGDPANTERAFAIVGVLVCGVAAATVLSSAGYSVSHAADAQFAESLRQRQISKLLRLRLDWFSRAGSGRIKQIVQDDVAKVHQLIAHVVPDFANGLVRPVATLVLLAIIDWRLLLVALVPLVITLACLPLMLKDMTARFEQYRSALGDLNASVVEYLHGIAPIKVFEASERGHRRFSASVSRHFRTYSEWNNDTVLGSALMMAFTSPGFAIAVSTTLTGGLVIAGALPPISLIPSVLLAANVAGPLYMLMQMSQHLREANGAAASVAEFFALPSESTGTAILVTEDTTVRVDEVSFAYADGPRALDRVSMDLMPGRVTALVGASGSGKSTFATLLPRLIDPDSGRITLGGMPTAEIPPVELYRRVAFVFQQPYLLRLSIRDNIRLARPDASDDEVVAASRAAQIHDRIERLPEGYDSVVGAGSRLSGGEQQRLSIARAVLMDAPILVLDEATAFADPDSEAAIQLALATLTRGRTLLVVAHRLHTITGADEILLLDGGGIRERGRHDELLAADGAYALMWRTYQASRDRGAEKARQDTRPATTTRSGT